MFFYDNINVKENVFFQSASWERHCATHWREQRGWDLVIFNWFVLSMRMQVILDSSFTRPGSAPIWGGKKGEFRDWTRYSSVAEDLKSWACLGQKILTTLPSVGKKPSILILCLGRQQIKILKSLCDTVAPVQSVIMISNTKNWTIPTGTTYSVNTAGASRDHDLLTACYDAHSAH